MTEPAVATPAQAELSAEAFSDLAERIEREIKTVIVGQDELVRHTLICLIANGHALLEGVPGLGKTMLVRTIADVIDCTFNRIQFTPDLMPADIVGTNVLIEQDGQRSRGRSAAGRPRVAGQARRWPACAARRRRSACRQAR